MKKYTILSVLMIASMLLISGAANSLIVSNNSDAVVVSATTTNSSATCGTVIKCVPSSECADGPCVPCTPEECAKRLGVDVETIHKAMSECKSTAATSGRLINSTDSGCNPADCPKAENCKNKTDCKPNPDCKSRCSNSSI